MDMNDIKHILWLFKQIVVCTLKGDIEGSIEASTLVRLHWNYKSNKINIIERR